MHTLCYTPGSSRRIAYHDFSRATHSNYTKRKTFIADLSFGQISFSLPFFNSAMEAEICNHLLPNSLDSARVLKRPFGVQKQAPECMVARSAELWLCRQANVKHLVAQEKGKRDWYSSYATRICRVERDYTFRKAEVAGKAADE